MSLNKVTNFAICVHIETRGNSDVPFHTLKHENQERSRPDSARATSRNLFESDTQLVRIRYLASRASNDSTTKLYTLLSYAWLLPTSTSGAIVSLDAVPWLMGTHKSMATSTRMLRACIPLLAPQQ